jgi:predicted nucleic acid-binding protein
VRACLLDTNIVSELHKGKKCSPQVQAWYDRCQGSDLFLSVLVLGEIRRGIELRRLKDKPTAHRLEKRLHELEVNYQERILPITAEICDLWGRLSLHARLPSIDGLLAATALHHELTLVTRNKKDVMRSGVDCFNPFVD